MKNKIVELIAANVEGLTAAEIADLIEIPPKPELGDFAFPCFRLAKTMQSPTDDCQRYQGSNRRCGFSAGDSGTRCLLELLRKEGIIYRNDGNCFYG